MNIVLIYILVIVTLYLFLFVPFCYILIITFFFKFCNSFFNFFYVFQEFLFKNPVFMQVLEDIYLLFFSLIFRNKKEMVLISFVYIEHARV